MRARSASTRLARPTVTAFELISARPSLAARVAGASPAAASASRARDARTVDDGLAFADQDERDVRELRQVGDADRAAAGHVRERYRR